MSARWPSWVSITLGVLSIPLAPIVGASVLGLYTIYEEGGLPPSHPPDAWMWVAGSVVVTVVGFALPITNAFLYRFAAREERAGRPRGKGGALVGLVLTAVGPVMITAGVVLLVLGMIVGVIGLWLTSLL